MNVVWIPPVALEDLDAISSLLREDPPIVSTLADFGNGQWEEFFHEHVQHGTEFYAHLDANFLSQLLRVFSPTPLSKHTRQAVSLMCLAVTFDMKVNPTFATHEYAFTGADPPDPRLAAFYHLDNLHPQRLADIALGRERGQFPSTEDLPPTIHENTHRQHLRMRGLTYASLLKIVELHRCTRGASDDDRLVDRFARAEALLDWMYHDFLFCGSPLFVTDQLWGHRRVKTVLKGIDTCDAGSVLAMCQNASWDLLLAENWAESESSREPRDPIHLVLTFDKALRDLAHQLLVKPDEQNVPQEQVILEKYRRSWPADMAASLAERYLRYQRTLDSPLRAWNSSKRPESADFIAYLERCVCDGLAA